VKDNHSRRGLFENGRDAPLAARLIKRKDEAVQGLAEKHNIRR